MVGGATIRTANFGSLVTELVSLPDWSGSGRLVVSLVPASGSGALAVEKKAQLKIRWQTPVTGSECPPLDLTADSAADSGGVCSGVTLSGVPPSNPSPTSSSKDGAANQADDAANQAVSSSAYLGGRGICLVALLITIVRL